MPTFTESEYAALIAGLHHIQDRLTAGRIAPDSLIGALLTKNGTYPFPTGDDLTPLMAQLVHASVTALPDPPDPPASAIDAVVKVVVLHPTSVFTPEAIRDQGFDNLSRYVDQMLADDNSEALISQEIMLVTGPRPLTQEEHETMYGDLPYPHPTQEEEN